MRSIALVIAFLAVLVAPAVAQKTKIEAVNAKWVELFGKGDFEGIAQLYTVDATAFPPGSAMVEGRAAIGAMWKGLAEHVSNPKVTTLDVKRLSRQLLIERREAGLKDRIIRRRRQQHADDAHALALLGVRNERNCRHAAQQTDEIASSYCRPRG